MATAAEIQAALADASDNDLTFSQMATLLKRAITNAIVSGATTIEIPWTTAASRGTTITRSIADAQNLLDFCLQRADSGVVGQYVEFTSPRATGCP